MREKIKEIIVNISENQTIIELSDLLQPYQSEIYVKKMFRGDIYEINLKSLLGLITIHLKNGDKVWVHAVGDDSEEALQVITDYLT